MLIDGDNSSSLDISRTGEIENNNNHYLSRALMGTIQANFISIGQRNTPQEILFFIGWRNTLQEIPILAQKITYLALLLKKKRTILPTGKPDLRLSGALRPHLGIQVKPDHGLFHFFRKSVGDDGLDKYSAIDEPYMLGDRSGAYTILRAVATSLNGIQSVGPGAHKSCDGKASRIHTPLPMTDNDHKY